MDTDCEPERVHRPATDVIVGDAAAFDAFYRREHAAVFRQVLLTCGAPDRADDITQEAFARAWMRWADVRQMDRPGGWVQRVAMRAAVKHKQRTHDWSELLERASEDDPVRALDADLVDALARLSPQQRAAIVLHVIDGFEHREIAGILGCSTATVRVHVHRARKALSDRITEVRHG